MTALWCLRLHISTPNYRYVLDAICLAHEEKSDLNGRRSLNGGSSPVQVCMCNVGIATQRPKLEIQQPSSADWPASYMSQSVIFLAGNASASSPRHFGALRLDSVTSSPVTGCA